MEILQDSENIIKNIKERPLFTPKGWVTSVGSTVVRGVVPGVKTKEMCLLRTPEGVETLSEVVGFDKENVILSPVGDTGGLSKDTEIIPLGRPHQVFLSPALKGHVLDGMGKVISKTEKSLPKGEACLVEAAPPDPLERTPIKEAYITGVKAIDALMTVGHGQRIGLFASPGVGKSTLISTMSQSEGVDTIVIALIGERGREVSEFLEAIPEKAREKVVVVVATSDKSPMERAKAAYVATSVAEYFRDRGERVLFLMDSITRYARALREVGLSAGEPPARRGYPPSIYRELPRLIERTGTSSKGSITAFYTVLVEGDDMNDPIADEVASLLDGQIILSRQLQQMGHYPAIDPLKSLSRCMNRVTSEGHQEAALMMKDYLAKYNEVKLLIDIGEYEKGHCAKTDRAIEIYPKMMAFLKQLGSSLSPYKETLLQMREVLES